MEASKPRNGEIIPPAHLAPKPKTDEQIILEELGEEDGRFAMAICDQLSASIDGLEAVAGAVRQMDGKSAARQFYRWRIRSAALSRTYARAMQSRSHVIAHRMLDELDAEPDPHMARVKLDALKWLAAKFNRADFGDEPGVQVNNTVNNLNDGGSIALEEIRQRLARKRKSMLSQPGGRVEAGGEGEGEVATQPLALPSGT